MQHEADVRLVNPEPKGHGRDDHLQRPLLPRPLHRLPRRRLEPRVVRRRPHASLAQPARHPLGVGARERVDDAGSAGVARGGDGGHLVELIRG